MSLKRRIAKLDVRYDECPTVCGQTEKVAHQFCSGCPLLKEDKRFRKETLSALAERVGADWEKRAGVGFEDLCQAVFDTLDAEDGDRDKWYVATEMLVEIVVRERNKLDRADHQNFMEEMKALKKGGTGNGKR